jgi:hypothetical protein
MSFDAERLDHPYHTAGIDPEADTDSDPDPVATAEQRLAQRRARARGLPADCAIAGISV